jgi:hypothetical protein
MLLHRKTVLPYKTKKWGKKREKAFFNTAQFQTNCAHESHALCQYYCKLCISVGFSKKGYGSFERKVRQSEPQLRPPKGHGVFFEGIFEIL